MFSKVTEVVEKAADQIILSRRRFFSSMGKAAGVVAGALAGVLAFRGKSRGGVVISCNCYVDSTFIGYISRTNCIAQGGYCI